MNLYTHYTAHAKCPTTLVWSRSFAMLAVDGMNIDS